jgi:hypothetical protein
VVAGCATVCGGGFTGVTTPGGGVADGGCIISGAGLLDAAYPPAIALGIWPFPGTPAGDIGICGATIFGGGGAAPGTDGPADGSAPAAGFPPFPLIALFTLPAGAGIAT